MYGIRLLYLNETFVSQPDLPSPADFGWTFSESGWHPVWSTMPDACTVDARSHVEDDANVLKLVLTVQIFVFVLDTAANKQSKAWIKKKKKLSHKLLTVIAMI